MINYRDHHLGIASHRVIIADYKKSPYIAHWLDSDDDDASLAAAFAFVLSNTAIGNISGNYATYIQVLCLVDELKSLDSKDKEIHFK